jgi:hypothetical protein
MNKKKVNPAKNIKLPAISITLEEIRHLFDLEESRRQSLENKTGILIGFLGVILTIVPIFSETSVAELLLFYIFIICSLIFAILSIRLTKYKIPHKNYDDFYKYAKMDEKKAMDQFLLNYIESAKNSEEINDTKIFFLKLSFLFIILAGLFSFLRAIYLSFFV